MSRDKRGRLSTALLWLLFLFVFAPFATAKQGEIQVEIDSSRVSSQSELAIWMAYLLERTAYRSKHNIPIPGPGEVVPSFDEEVFARSETVQIYRELKAKDKTLNDAYWEAVSLVKEAGFIKPYVWLYFRRQSWPLSQQPSNVDSFIKWRANHLNNHKLPPTIGRLVAPK